MVPTGHDRRDRQMRSSGVIIVIKRQQKFLAMLADRRGITAMEYAVVAGAILAVALVAFKALGISLATTIGAVSLSRSLSTGPG